MYRLMTLYCFFAVGLLLSAGGYCRADELRELEQRIEFLERFKERVEDELEQGGRRFPTVSFNSRLPLRDHDYLRLQFLGAKNGWLGCDQPVCDLCTCPSYNHNYRYFDSRCSGEKFQIISDGNQGSSVTSGQRIRLRYLHKHNSWMGCSHKNRCEKNTCPGTTSQGTNFRNNRCSGEIFKIYARGRDYGQTIYNGDVVMLYYAQGQRYVSIQGEDLGHDTRLNFCPGIAPPAYLSYGICSENVFRIYRKP